MVKPTNRASAEQPPGSATLDLPLHLDGLQGPQPARVHQALRDAILAGRLAPGSRIALLDWARNADAWVLEDDYDSEFRYAGAPLTALAGIDAARRVIYFGTFSKMLFPGLRMGTSSCRRRFSRRSSPPGPLWIAFRPASWNPPSPT